MSNYTILGITGSAGGTVTTVNGGNNITITGNPSVNPTVNVSGTTNHRVQVGNASGSLTSLPAGTVGFALTSQGAGSDPIWAALGGAGVSTITGDAGGAVTGGVILTGGSTGLVFTGSAGTTLTASFAGITANGGTVSLATDATASAINIGTGAGNKTVTLGSTNTTSTTNLQSGSGGIKIPAFTEGALVTSVTGVISTVTGASGTVLTANTAGTAPSFQAPQFVPFVWVDVPGASQTMDPNTGYTANNAAPVVFTLPAVCDYGSIIRVVGKGAGGWQINQNAGQTIYFGTFATTTGVAGGLDSTDDRDCVELLCVVADTDFEVISVIGNLTIT